MILTWAPNWYSLTSNSGPLVKPNQIRQSNNTSFKTRMFTAVPTTGRRWNMPRASSIQSIHHSLTVTRRSAGVCPFTAADVTSHGNVLRHFNPLHATRTLVNVTNDVWHLKCLSKSEIQRRREALISLSHATGQQYFRFQLRWHLARRHIVQFTM
jgi:hypothetical protein